jgi:hypothetical protein
MGRWTLRALQLGAETDEAADESAAPMETIEAMEASTPTTAHDPLAPLLGEEPSVWCVIHLRACRAYNWSTWCVSDPRRPERCLHCCRPLSPEQQGNPYDPYL